MSESGLRILRKPELLRRLGFSDMHLASMEARGEFPRRIQTGQRSVGWVEQEVDEWVRARMRERDDAAKAEAERVARMPPAVRHRWRTEREGVPPA